MNGIFFNAATTLKPTFSNFYKATITQANSEDTTAFVIDDPFQQYVVGADDATGVTTMLATYDMNTSAGSDITGKSSSTLDISETSANGKQFRMLRSAEDPENEDATAVRRSVIVVSNRNSFNGHNYKEQLDNGNITITASTRERTRPEYTMWAGTTTV